MTGLDMLVPPRLTAPPWLLKEYTCVPGAAIEPWMLEVGLRHVRKAESAPSSAFSTAIVFVSGGRVTGRPLASMNWLLSAAAVHGPSSRASTASLPAAVACTTRC